MVLSNSSSSPNVDACVLYKTSTDNFSLDQSKIIAQPNDNISASYSSLASLHRQENNINNIITATAVTATSTTTTITPPQLTTHLITTTTQQNNKYNTVNTMVLQNHHIQPLINTDHYHHQTSPISLSPETSFGRSSFIYMYSSPYTTNSPPTTTSTPQNHYQLTTTGHRTINDLIDETVKDEPCTMIDGINNSTNSVLVAANLNFNGNHSAHNSDDGENHHSPSPHMVTATTAANLSDEYESNGGQSFTNLTIISDSQSMLNRESVYSSGTALSTPNNVTTVASSSSIIHPIQAYDVLHTSTPGR